ncbi:MAG: hypothetical protein U0Y82_09755 [Thermoleophilia bacterium]
MTTQQLPLLRSDAAVFGGSRLRSVGATLVVLLALGLLALWVAVAAFGVDPASTVRWAHAAVLHTAALRPVLHAGARR